MSNHKIMTSPLRQPFFHALLILPAIALGLLAMISGGVSPVLWGQQAAAFVIFALLSPLLSRAARRIPAAAWSLVFAAILAATLLGEEAGGAKRWIDLVVFHANAAQLVLPALLAVLCCVKHPSGAVLIAAVVLSFQPNVPELTAFGAASLVLLWRHENKRSLALISAAALCLLLIRCVCVPVSLEPVSYCEGILDMLLELSPLLAAAGWAALLAIPGCFIYRFLRRGETHHLAIAVYYAVTLLFVLTGDHPVPFMGFGLSTIAGYWLAAVFTDSFSSPLAPGSKT